LERQIASLEDYARKQFPQAEYVVIKDVASGLKENREGLRKLIDLARRRQIDAVVVVGNIRRGKKKLIEKTEKNCLRHRIHQWSVSKLVETLNNKPIHVVEISEAYSSSIDPFTGKHIKRFNPSVIRCAVRGVKRVRVVKVILRVSDNGLDRDVIGAVNIGLRYLNSDGSPMALDSTELHEVRVKLVNPHRELTQTTELRIFRST